MRVLPLLALTVLGAVVRVVVAHQSIFADELSTYWISATHGLGGVISLLYGTGRIHHAEITPPLSFLASWVSTRFGHSPELLRAPALLSGTATIPLVYMLGLRTIGRRPAFVAAALTAFSPFMIYYSAEARAYGLMMCCVVCSALAMLLAIDTGRTRWWVLYGLSSAAAFYTHYTSAFVLAAALLWMLWAHPQARRAALVANIGAAVLVLPWIPGLINDFNSPTLTILSLLSPFSVHDIRLDLEHWAIGYPYTFAGRLPDLPGVPALVLLGSAAATACAGLGSRGRTCLIARSRPCFRAGLLEAVDRRVLLVLLLAAVTPVAEIVVSATGDHILGVRDLAASWPFLGLTMALVLASAGPRLGLAASALAILAFALGTSRMFESQFQRPDYRAAADVIARSARPGDVVVDETGAYSPGPLTGLDVALHLRLPTFRGQAPAERNHPFGFSDPIFPLSVAVRDAVAAARHHHVFVVTNLYAAVFGLTTRLQLGPASFPGSYRRISVHHWNGIGGTVVAEYAYAGPPSG